MDFYPTIGELNIRRHEESANLRPFWARLHRNTQKCLFFYFTLNSADSRKNKNRPLSLKKARRYVGIFGDPK